MAPHPLRLASWLCFDLIGSSGCERSRCVEKMFAHALLRRTKVSRPCLRLSRHHWLLHNARQGQLLWRTAIPQRLRLNASRWQYGGCAHANHCTAGHKEFSACRRSHPGGRACLNDLALLESAVYLRQPNVIHRDYTLDAPDCCPAELRDELMRQLQEILHRLFRSRTQSRHPRVCL